MAELTGSIEWPFLPMVESCSQPDRGTMAFESGNWVGNSSGLMRRAIGPCSGPSDARLREP